MRSAKIRDQMGRWFLYAVLSALLTVFLGLLMLCGAAVASACLAAAEALF